MMEEFNLDEIKKEYERLIPIYQKNMEESKNKTFEINFKTESEISGNCPVCNEHYWNSCRCFLLDRSCVNGHKRHYDLKPEKYILVLPITMATVVCWPQRLI